MIPTATITAFWIAFTLTTVAPVLLAVILLVKRRINGLPLVLGVLAFFVSQIVIRLPLLQLLATQDWYQQFSQRLMPFIIVITLSAGLFEECARLGGALILKTQRSYKDIISFGLGHGLCEAFFIVGMTHFNNLIFSYAINGGVDQNAITATLPTETMTTVTAQLVAASVVSIYAGVLERLAAILFHIFATFLVFYGVTVGRRWVYLSLAIVTHALFNIIAFFTLRATGPIITVPVLLILGASCAYYVWRQRGNPLLHPSPQRALA